MSVLGASPRPPRLSFSLEGRRALVVGGAGHIGYACCEALADLGASVAIADVDRDRAEALAAQLAERTTGEVAGLRCDVTEESFDELRENVLTAFGGLDVLVYSAGMTGATRSTGWGGPFEDQGAAAWRLANEINVHGFFRLVQALVEDLRQSQGASVIAVSSIYATNGQRPDLYFGTEMSNPAAYGASKAALSQVVRWLSSTLAPAIRVNAVSPGGIAVDRIRRFRSDTRSLSHSPGWGSRKTLRVWCRCWPETRRATSRASTFRSTVATAPSDRTGGEPDRVGLWRSLPTS